MCPLTGGYAIGQQKTINISADAEALVDIITREWRSETGQEISNTPALGNAYSFSMGCGGELSGPINAHSEAYRLEVNENGILAGANTYAGLVYAWQTLKQVLRHDTNHIPCMRIHDWPNLRWRIYHLDLKATRRRLSNLHEILPKLSELKINAVLVEYEDYILLERHPELAITGALTKEEIRPWIAAAADHGIAVIPLVQTLGHWQYILGRPEYAHLQEKPGDTTTACPSQEETWTLATDFLDEIIELHREAPFIHAGLDECFHLGVCDKCQKRLNGRKPAYLFAQWSNRITDYILERGSQVMMWSDVVQTLDTETMLEMSKEAYHVGDVGGYVTGSPLHTQVGLWGKTFISREWLRRPEGQISDVHPINFIPPYEILEDLPEEQFKLAKPYVDNPEYPKKLRADVAMAWRRDMDMKNGGVSGIRVSYHGCIAPMFIHGQLNTLAWANLCKHNDATFLIGSSWARGHSFARINAHPELDWYGIATLGDACWGSLTENELRDFDERFAFQFFGLPDGHIGDLYYLFDRSHPRAHDTMENYYEYIVAECGKSMPIATRNKPCLNLFAEMADLQVLRMKTQTTLLEMEYFYANKEGVPQAFKERMLKDITDASEETDRRKSHLEGIYKETLIDADSTELAAAQLHFFRDAMMSMKDLFFQTT